MDILFSNIESLFGMAPWGVGVVCVLVFLAGYVDAIAGGGGLVSLPAYMIAGLPTHAAIATNKLSSSMGTVVATLHYARSGFINLKLALPCIACAMAGSVAGSNLVLLVSDSILKIALLVILPITAVYVIRKKNFGTQLEAYSPRRTAVLCSGIALAVGVYDGFYGPGTGTFLMLLLNGLAHLRLDESAGITKAINLTTNLAALAVFLFHGEVLVAIGLLAGAFNIAGNYIGARSFTSKGGGIARPITIVVLVIFFCKVIYDLVTTGL